MKRLQVLTLKAWVIILLLLSTHVYILRQNMAHFNLSFLHSYISYATGSSIMGKM